jgi:hypothetical protein
MRGSPNIRVDLDSVEPTKGIASISQGYFEDAAIYALERLCFLRFATLRGKVSASSMSL